MTVVHLVRHAEFPGIGRLLPGRNAEVMLSDEGRAQAQRLGAVLPAHDVAAVYTTPLGRTHETAVAIAAPRGLTPIPLPEFTEVDFGEWMGRDMAELDDQPVWRTYNAVRSLTPAPGGELLLEIQARTIRCLLELRRRHEQETIVIVTHADVIRAVLLHLLGMPNDHLLRLEIAPASWSTIELHESGPRVLCVGCTAA